MIDFEDTTMEWQTHTGDICVLPVGATEQHSHHLPVATDTIQAEYWARIAADAVNGALLPTMPYGTSLEHTGFRGSFTLKPETLMQFVRDVAAAMARQHFKILIVMSGHGGNHALRPVVDDINRRREGIQCLLLAPWMAMKSTAFNESAHLGAEFHAGESETSRIMALRPELVRDARLDMPPPTGEIPLIQEDLTTFGMGFFNPTGAVGWPSYASREKGETLLAAVREVLPVYVRERVAALRADVARDQGPGAGGSTRVSRHV